MAKQQLSLSELMHMDGEIVIIGSSKHTVQLGSDGLYLVGKNSTYTAAAVRVGYIKAYRCKEAI